MFTTRRRPQSTPRRPLQCEQLEDRLALAPLVPPLDALAVPAYHSLPGAPANLYLDFDGHHQADWAGHTPGTTPAFDADGNPDSFSDTERTAIKEIWLRVVEDFAPFNINVTTVEPLPFDDSRDLRVVIGGSYNDWLHAAASGVAWPNSFTNPYPNVCYVFSEDIDSWADAFDVDGDGMPIQLGAAVATTASHEAGHAFGLFHQSRYGPPGFAEYNPGTAARTPIMGHNLCSDRTTWHDGTTTSATTFQDDMAILASPTNGFGYRPDDHSNTQFGANPRVRGATPLTIPGVSWVWASHLTGSGVIEQITDDDWFKFTTLGGSVSLTVSPVVIGPNLDVSIELYGAGSAPLLTDDPTTALGASFATTLPAGTYYVKVSSHGEYGDVGQYTVAATGRFVNSPPIEVGPPRIDPFTMAGSGPLGATLPVRGAHPELTEAVLPQAGDENDRRANGTVDFASTPLITAKPTAVIGIRIQADESVDLWTR